MNSAYKVYAMVFTERLREEIEDKEILPESQAGFKKGRSTMDNIYILQHVVEKVGKQKKRKGMCVLHRFKNSVSVGK